MSGRVALSPRDGAVEADTLKNGSNSAQQMKRTPDVKPGERFCHSRVMRRFASWLILLTG